MTSKQKKLDRTPVISKVSHNRVYIPQHFFHHLDLKAGDSIQAELVGKKVLFRKVDAKKSK